MQKNMNILNIHININFQVQDSQDVIKDGRIRVVFSVPHEPQLEPLIQNQHVRRAFESFCGYVRLVLRVFSPHLIRFCVSCRNTAWNTVPDTFWPLVSASPVTSSRASLEASSLVEALRRSECLCRNAKRISAVSCCWHHVTCSGTVLVWAFSLLHCVQSLWGAKS